MRITWHVLLAAFLVGLLTAPMFGAEPIAALIIDGQNNHDFVHTTPWLKKQLETTGRFRVDVSTTPPAGPRLKPGEKEPAEAAAARRGAWEKWRPDFARYKVVVINYNGEDWPEPVMRSFEQHVQKGGGVFIVHAGNNPFANWKAFNEMIGLGWRGANFGYRLVWNTATNKPERIAANEGPGAGHGAQHAYKVIVRDASHPVMQGLPSVWMHPKDELYHGQRGPAENMHVLVTAYSDPKGAGGERSTGAHEPLVWWIPHGEGKVFTCLFGHVGRSKDNTPPDLSAMRDTAFIAILQRGCEWVATGKVTIGLPSKLPTESQEQLAPLEP